MSYDIIETLVLKEQRELRPASIIQEEGEIQLKRYIPLEVPKVVLPKLEQLKTNVVRFYGCAASIQKNFILCGYFLNVIKRENLYRFCAQEGERGYSNFYRFCEDKLGISSSTAKRLININSHFCKNSRELNPLYVGFGASKLAIMSTFQNGLECKVTPDVTVGTLNKLQKYYSSHGWEVSPETSWRDDVRAYEEERNVKTQAERAYLNRHKFESAKEQAAASALTKKTKYVSDSYKKYTRFLDQTTNTLETFARENTRFATMFAELNAMVHQAKSEILSAESEEMLEGL